MKKFLTLLFLLLVGALSSQAQQKYTVSGYIMDRASSEPLIGAAVIDKASGMGTVSSNTGYYSLSIPSGKRQLEIVCLGYENKVFELEVEGNMTFDVKIREVSMEISAATVTGSRTETGVRGTQMSAIEVPVNQIKAIPAIGGEVDIIKALQLLPGVQSGSEGTAGMYVRGGGADENLLLMDGVPLYNVNHMFGFFSVFNADAVKNVTLYKGSFPARFGGHLSSVVDVRMKDGNDSEYHGNITVGLISSKFNVEGPIVKGSTTFDVSARRTYLDLIAAPLIAYLNYKENIGSDYKSYFSGGYDFYDFNAKITHRFKNNDRLSLSFYSGDDRAHIGLSEDDTYYRYLPSDPITNRPDKDRLNYVKSTEDMKFGWSWGNLVAAMRFSHEITRKLYWISGLNYTRYRSNLGVGMEEYESSFVNGKERDIVKMNADLKYNSLINDMNVVEDFEWRPSVNHDVKFGATYIHHSFKPGIISASESFSDSSVPELNQKFNQKIGETPLFSHEAAIYAEDNWTIAPWLKANLGLRGSMYNVSGKTYWSAEPRLSARVLFSRQFSFKASYSEMSQYIHLLCNSNLSLPSDLWVPVTNNIKPMRSRQSAAGFFWDLGKFEFSLEGYYKDMENVLEYKDGASYMSTSTGWEEKVCMGRGWSYGLEFFAQKKIGKFTGWIGYTLAKSMRQFDRPGNVINDGIPFPAKYDRTHDLSTTFTYAFSKKFDLSATFIYASGNCGSLGFDEYDTPAVYGYAPEVYFEGLYYSTSTYLPHRNNYRMPAYSRLDIGVNFYKQKKHGTRIWNISVYNALNRKNPYMLYVDEEWTYDWKKDEYTSRNVLQQVSIFPLIPSVSYTFKF